MRAVRLEVVMFDGSTSMDDVIAAVMEMAVPEAPRAPATAAAARPRATETAAQESTSELPRGTSTAPSLVMQHTAAQLRLHDRFLERRAVQAAADADEARDLREALDTRLWEEFGCATALEYMERYCGYSRRAAYDRLRVAEDLGKLPRLEAELAAGNLCYSHVRELVRVVVPATQREWIEHVRRMTVSQVEREVSGRVKGNKPTTEKNPDNEIKTICFKGRPSTIARLRALLSDVEHERGDKFVDDDDRTQALCDAIESGGGGAKAPTQVWKAADGRAFSNGVQIASEVEAAMVCTAADMGDVEDPNARKRTKFSKARRTRLLARDGDKCTFPGCESKRYIDLHHIVPVVDGGTNADINVTSICGGHHRLLHRGLIEIRGFAPDRLVFRRADPDDDI